MVWSEWQQTAPGKYRTSNLDTGRAGKNAQGLPNPPSVPALPTSSNCAYRVIGVWKILTKDGQLSNPSELLGSITLYNQRIYQGTIFDWQSIGFPVYYFGRFASFDGVAKVDNSVQYGNQDIRCALGVVGNSHYPNQTPFLYGNWHKDLDYEIVFVDIFAEGLLNCDFTFSPSILTPKLYLGTAAPPPPPPRKMDCCDCNTIATIVEDKITNALKPSVENLKDHIDQRSKELTVIHQKQLEAMEIDLKPVINRLNEVERNLWNGILK